MPTTKQERLYLELKLALAKTKSEDLKARGSRSASNLPTIAARRVKNLGGLLTSLAKFSGMELIDAIRAMSKGRFGKHFGERSAAAIDSTLAIANQIKNTTSAIGNALFSDPKANAPGVLALAFGFLAGSGGVDANGGLPDTDLALGIGWHRSPLTHSIIAGVVVEGAILALVDLADVIHDKLPSNHDQFWDKLAAAKSEIALRLTQGASAGIAYHLGVDATLQPGAYHGMPMEMPMEAHQIIFGVNALAEGLDATNKEETTGKRFVNGVSRVGRDGKKALLVGWNKFFPHK